MKPVSDMNRLELAAFIAAEFQRRRINVVLSGGSCVSIYSAGKYVSMDLDFVNAGFAKRAAIKETMEFLGEAKRVATFVIRMRNCSSSFTRGLWALVKNW